MIKTFTFGKKNNNNSSSIFHTSSKPNYSKILDGIIFADIIDKNDYLFNYSKKNEDADYFMSKTFPYTKTTIIGNSKLANATKFLANYAKYNTEYKLPYIIGKCYTLSDGTPIVFYENNIQIGYDFYDYNDFLSAKFLNTLTPKKKQIIIDIYLNGAKNIDINIL